MGQEVVVDNFELFFPCIGFRRQGPWVSPAQGHREGCLWGQVTGWSSGLHLILVEISRGWENWWQEGWCQLYPEANQTRNLGVLFLPKHFKIIPWSECIKKGSLGCGKGRQHVSLKSCMLKPHLISTKEQAFPSFVWFVPFLGGSWLASCLWHKAQLPWAVFLVHQCPAKVLWTTFPETTKLWLV